MCDIDHVTEYAERIVNGEVLAGNPVVSACQRHLIDLQRQDDDDFAYYYDHEKAKKVIQFIEMLPNTTTGEPLKLAPFQKFIIGSIYGWYRDGTDFRRFTKATVSLSRKQGKTLINSGMGIWELIAGKPAVNRSITLSSNSREQSMILFNMVKQQTDKLVSKSPTLRNQIRQVRNEISYTPDYSVIKPTSSDYGSMDGYEISFGIIDEYAASPTTRLLDVIESSQIQLDNPLIMIISTAGYNTNHPFYEERKYAEDVAKGEENNENYFSYVAVQDDLDEVNKPETWIKSNPLLEIPELKDKMMRNLESQLREAQAKNDVMEFQIKNLNYYLQASQDSFVPVKEWEACKLDYDIDIHGKEAYVGLDLSRVGDITALNFMIPISDDELYTFSHSFVSSVVDIESKSKQDKIDYQMMIDNGFMTLSNSASGFISYEQVINKLFEVIDLNELDVVSIQYDDWGADKFILEYEELAKDTPHIDIPFVNVPQNYKHLSQPIKEFQMKIYERNIKHDNNPLTNIAINNAILRYDNNRNVILDKTKARNKIDNLVAMIIAFYEARFHHYKENSMEIDEAYIMSEDFSF